MQYFLRLFLLQTIECIAKIEQILNLPLEATLGITGIVKKELNSKNLANKFI